MWSCEHWDSGHFWYVTIHVSVCRWLDIPNSMLLGLIIKIFALVYILHLCLVHLSRGLLVLSLTWMLFDLLSNSFQHAADERIRLEEMRQKVSLVLHNNIFFWKILYIGIICLLVDVLGSFWWNEVNKLSGKGERLGMMYTLLESIGNFRKTRI